MKISITLIASLLSLTTLYAQPVLNSDNLNTGLSFHLYLLSNVNTANLVATGANVSWDLSSATATLSGTADFLEMSDTPYEDEYPEANFAMRFSQPAGTFQYSLFNLTESVFEEVANNVGTDDPVSFLNPRTTLVFPFTFSLFNSDDYQKENQNVKTTENTYDAFGTLITNPTSFTDIVRINTSDDGSTGITWWKSNPVAPLFRGTSEGFVLWELTSTTGINEVPQNSLFEMYPNPAADELHIMNRVPISRMDVFNSTGQLQFSTTQSNIDISGLKSGVYLLKAWSENGTASQRFIKQ